jgi:hypothetical protein
MAGLTGSNFDFSVSFIGEFVCQGTLIFLWGNFYKEEVSKGIKGKGLSKI